MATSVSPGSGATAGPAADGRRRRRLLADVAAALEPALGLDQRLRALAGILSRRVADVCVIELLDDDGRLAPAAHATRGADPDPPVEWLRRQHPLPAADARSVHAVLRTGRPVLVPEITAGMLEAYIAATGIAEPAAAAFRARPPRSLAIVPLAARGRALGAVLCLTYGDRTLDRADLALLEETGRRAGVAIDDARLFEEARRTAERLRLLQQATAALSSAVTPDEVGAAAVACTRDLLGAKTATIYELAGDALAVLARDANATRDIAAWEQVPLAAPVPVSDAARARQPVWLDGPGAWARRYPELVAEAERRGIGAGVALPLVAGDEVTGCIALAFGGERRFADADRDTARVLAEACGQALARARLQRDAEAERHRAEVLAEVSYTLDAESGVDDRLARLLALLVPATADLATVRLAGPPGRPSTLAAVAHVDPAKERLARSLYSRYTPPPERPGPARVMATGGAELILEATDEIRDAYAPDGAFAAEVGRLGIVSYMSLPLCARGAVLGALTLMTTSDSGRRYGRPDLALAVEVAHRAALAIDNARRYEGEQRARAAAERARRRTERLQRVTSALAAALDEEEVARVVVGEAVQALAAVAGVVVVREGDRGRVLVATGYPDDLLRPGDHIAIDAPMPLAAVLREGTEFWFEAGDDWTERFGPPRAALGPAAIVLPLRIGARVMGAIGFRFGRQARRFPPGDRHLALAMAGQCAQALERARLYGSDRHAADVLQRALLPPTLPPMAAARLDVRYVPAAGGRSGGDFYDAIELPDGRISVVVGDVVGHGTEAAAVMGQLRSAWRAFALDGAGPATLVRRLGAFARQVEGAAVATVACGVLRGSELRYACAGHPPPLLRDPYGATRYLLDGRGPPLTVGETSDEEGGATLAPGSLLLLYTDGMIERDRDIDRGMRELAEMVADGHGAATDPLDRLAAHIGPVPADDCALLALTPSEAPARLSVTIAADPTQLRSARAEVRRWLGTAGLSPGDAEDALLAVSEALANGVEHAYADRPPGARGSVSVELAREADGTVSGAVRDDGSWRPPHAVPGTRGRGLSLMRAIMDSVHVEREAGGTTIRMRIGGRRATGAPPAGEAGAPAHPGGTWDDPIVLSMELDVATAPQAADRLRALAGAGVGTVTVDLSAAPHMGSAGVRVMVEFAAELRAAGRRLAVVAPPGTPARRVLDLSGVGSAFAVVDRRPA